MATYKLFPNNMHKSTLIQAISNNLFRFSGIAGVIILWTVTIIGMNLSGLGLIDDRPISFIGVQDQTALFFNIGLGASALLFFVFGLYLNNKYTLSKWFIVLLGIGQLAQIVAAIFPYGGSVKIIHTTAAFILAGCIPLYMKAFAVSLKTGPFKRKAFLLYNLEKTCFVVGIGAFVFLSGISPLAEILPALPFHAWIYWLSLKT